MLIIVFLLRFTPLLFNIYTFNANFCFNPSPKVSFCQLSESQYFAILRQCDFLLILQCNSEMEATEADK